MKLTSFRVNGRTSYGIVHNEGVIDLGKRLTGCSSLKELIEQHKMSEAASLATDGNVDYSLNDIEFLPVITQPGKIFCVGMNYMTHIKEINREKTEYPALFVRFADSQVGHNEPILLPKESETLDYEGEMAVIIGKEGRRIPEKDAYEYIAGYACYNDATIREWQRHTSQFTAGKNFEGTGAFGPWMVTRDEIGDNESLTLETRLNGEVLQHATTDQLIFPIPELIHYISTVITLKPGDVIVTGTPGGVGFKREPQVFMKPGDVVEVEVSKIGVLRNEIKKDA